MFPSSCGASQVRLLLLIKDKRRTGKAQQGLERLGKAQGEGKDRRRVRCTDCTSSARDSREGGGAPPPLNLNLEFLKETLTEQFSRVQVDTKDKKSTINNISIPFLQDISFSLKRQVCQNKLRSRIK